MDKFHQLLFVDNLRALLVLVVKPLVEVLVYKLVLLVQEVPHDFVDEVESLDFVQSADFEGVELKPNFVD